MSRKCEPCRWEDVHVSMREYSHKLNDISSPWDTDLRPSAQYPHMRILDRFWTRDVCVSSLIPNITSETFTSKGYHNVLSQGNVSFIRRTTSTTLTTHLDVYGHFNPQRMCYPADKTAPVIQCFGLETRDLTIPSATGFVQSSGSNGLVLSAKQNEFVNELAKRITCTSVSMSLSTLVRPNLW